MPYNQRDLVALKKPAKLPDGKEEYHYFLIINSNLHSNQDKQGCYLGIMMSTTDYHNRFSIPLSDDMFESKLEKSNSKLRMHLIISFFDDDILKLKNRMLKPHFIRIMNELKGFAFSID